MKYAEVSRRLRTLGCVEVPRRGGGSHRKWRNLATGQGSVVPDWGPRDLKQGTLRAIVKQLGIPWDEFDVR